MISAPGDNTFLPRCDGPATSATTPATVNSVDRTPVNVSVLPTASAAEPKSSIAVLSASTAVLWRASAPRVSPATTVKSKMSSHSGSVARMPRSVPGALPAETAAPTLSWRATAASSGISLATFAATPGPLRRPSSAR